VEVGIAAACPGPGVAVGEGATAATVASGASVGVGAEPEEPEEAEEVAEPQAIAATMMIAVVTRPRAAGVGATLLPFMCLSLFQPYWRLF
jgi:hypothetical protein